MTSAKSLSNSHWIHEDTHETQQLPLLYVESIRGRDGEVFEISENPPTLAPLASQGLPSASRQTLTSATHEKK
ncbi:hypothetical protein E2C01_077730 [Portunus trituberculatus]|uniref:Uncharacterized protein n=1 Tax=Portunus trituberculatus TaxID=210409 RepID=A0A5B7IF69_PORTR|nr:hypothetical protein [Portunus trituberculatus]